MLYHRDVPAGLHTSPLASPYNLLSPPANPEHCYNRVIYETCVHICNDARDPEIIKHWTLSLRGNRAGIHVLRQRPKLAAMRDVLQAHVDAKSCAGGECTVF